MQTWAKMVINMSAKGMISAVAAFIMLSLVVAPLLGQTAPPTADAVAAEIQRAMPKGWTCTLVKEKGKMGHPHGLCEPSFRLDFVNKVATFRDTFGGQTQDVHPNLRLHFHPIGERDRVLKTIQAESIMSWDIPVLFAETKDYIVVTSVVEELHDV